VTVHAPAMLNCLDGWKSLERTRPQTRFSGAMDCTILSSILCAASLFGLCTYSAVVGPGQSDSLPKALANPHLDAGLVLRLPSVVRVMEVRPQEFWVHQRGAQIVVRIPEQLEQDWMGRGQQLQAGDYVSLEATFHPDGYLLLRDMHVHKGRRLKIWVSLLALLVLAGLLLHERRPHLPRA
jgi:hypothetical protein